MLGFASTLCCLVVVASFVLFAVNQTSMASRAQVSELGGAPSASSSQGSGSSANAGTSSTHESAGHRRLDEAAEALTSPFSGLTSSMHNEWVAKGVGTLLALLLYGVVLRFLMRAVQVRARTAQLGTH
jgi:hypothetical protein